MSKIKIEIRKPQYLAAKDPGGKAGGEGGKKAKPFFFQLLLIATYILSGIAIWYVYQKLAASA